MQATADPTTFSLLDRLASRPAGERAALAAGAPVALDERRGRRRSMTPLHRRDEDETYLVVEGEVTFFVDDGVKAARAGDAVNAPAGAARTLRVESDSARWVVLTHVRSPERFHDFGRALAAPSPHWPSSEELASLTALANANGVDLLGPPGALPAR